MEGLLIYLVLINIISFFTMYLDKRRARRGEWRVPEKRLWLLAISGGAIGVLAGMKAFRHKTKHATFTYGVPAVIILNLICLYVVYTYLMV